MKQLVIPIHAQTTPAEVVAVLAALGGFRRGRRAPVHHSDRGVQYCCREYMAELAAHGFLVSMTETGEPRDNPVAERLNGVLKHELGLGGAFPSHAEAALAVARAVALYNEKRPHGSVDYLTPDVAHQREGRIPMRWVNYRRKRALAAAAGLNPDSG